MSKERRIAERIDTQPGTLHVVDTINNITIGTIANLSSTGFMLVTDQLIEVDSVFQLSLQSASDALDIHLGALCLWHAEAGAVETYWSGFQIIDISDRAQHQLDHLVELLISS